MSLQPALDAEHELEYRTTAHRTRFVGVGIDTKCQRTALQRMQPFRQAFYLGHATAGSETVLATCRLIPKRGSAGDDQAVVGKIMIAVMIAVMIANLNGASIGRHAADLARVVADSHAIEEAFQRNFHLLRRRLAGRNPDHARVEREHRPGRDEVDPQTPVQLAQGLGSGQRAEAGADDGYSVHESTVLADRVLIESVPHGRRVVQGRDMRRATD